MAARANSWLLGNARGATVHQGKHHSALVRMFTKGDTILHQGEHHSAPERTSQCTRENITVH